MHVVNVDLKFVDNFFHILFTFKVFIQELKDIILSTTIANSIYS